VPRWLPNIVDHTSFLKLFTVVPVIVTAYICHFNGMDYCPSSLVLHLIVCVATSFFSVLLFGDQIMDDVMVNFDTNFGVPYSAVLNDIVRMPTLYI